MGRASVRSDIFFTGLLRKTSWANCQKRLVSVSAP